MSNLIHIGLPKAGSTSLQDGVFSRVESRIYLGKIHNQYVSGPARELIHRVAYNDSIDYDETHVRSILDRIKADAGGHASPPVILSDEQFSVEGGVDRKMMAERLRRLLFPATVLIIIRSQYKVCESMYLHYCRSSGERRLSYQEWLDKTYGQMDPGHHRVGMNYHSLISCYRELFGRENVKVVPFETLFSRNGIALEQLTDLFADSDGWAVSADVLTKENSRQTRLQQSIVDIQNQLPGRMNFALLGRRLLPPWLYQPLRKMVISGRPIKSPEMPPEWKQMVVDLCGPSNERLIGELGLPLDKLGYPIK